MGGGGGTTAGAGAASGGGTPTVPMGGMGMLEGALMHAQLENVNANTKKQEAEATNIETNTGKQQAETINIVQDTNNKKAVEQQTKLNNLMQSMQNEIVAATKDNIVELSEQQVQRGLLELQELGNDVFISNNTIHDTIKTIKLKAVGADLENQLKEQQITLTKEQIEKVKEETWQLTVTAQQNHEKIKIEDFKAKLAAILGQAGLDIAKSKVAIDAISAALTAGWSRSGGEMKPPQNPYGDFKGYTTNTSY